MAKYTVNGKEVYRPYREFGYIEKGGPDPNSKRQRDKDKKGAKGGKCPRGKGDAEGQNVDSQPTVEAPT